MSELVAHRGQKFNFPENTLLSINEAIACGATAVEFDVQMTADYVPVVCHDSSLLKTAGVDIDITQANYADIKNISVGEPARFADKYKAVKLPTLQAMITLLKASPHVTVFVELKDASIDAFGIDHCLQSIIPQLEPIKSHCVVIANNLPTLLRLKQQTSLPIGWIIHRWHEDDLALANQSDIDYVFIGLKYCPAQGYDFSADSWDWAVHQTNDPDLALAFFEQGVRFVESDDICSMLKQLPEDKMPIYNTGSGR